MKSGLPVISVITTCRNSAATIEKTILSVLSQSYPNIEYVIVDGASTDGTQEIIRKYEKRIARWISEPDTGVYDGMNKGIRLATGDWIHLLNSDDYYCDSDAVSRAVPFLDPANINYFRVSFITIDGTVRRRFHGFNWLLMWYSGCVPHPTLIVSRAQYESVGLYDTSMRIAADHELILRLLKRYPPAPHPDSLSVMRMGGLSSVHNEIGYLEVRKANIRHGLPAVIAWLFWAIKILRSRLTHSHLIYRECIPSSASAAGASHANATCVLHMLRSYGRHGGEAQLGRMLRGNRPAGVREHFVLLFRDACMRDFAAIPGLATTTLLPVAVPPSARLSVELGKTALLLPFLWLSFARQLLRVRPQLVFTHNIQSLLVAWPFAFFSRSIVFAYVHRAYKPPRKSHRLLRLLYRPFRFFGGVSRAAADSLRPVVVPRIPEPILNGIPVLPPEPPEDRPPPRGCRAVVVGRLLPGKRVDFVIEAVRLARQAGADVHLHVIGGGPQLPALRRQVAAAGLREYIVFFGAHPDVRSVLRSADLFLCASEAEGLSNAVLEGMEMGLPSVVVDAPGVTECHVHGETALVVDREPAAMAADIQRLVAAPALRRRMGAAARERVASEFSIESNRERYLGLYQRLQHNSLPLCVES